MLGSREQDFKCVSVCVVYRERFHQEDGSNPLRCSRVSRLCLLSERAFCASKSNVSVRCLYRLERMFERFGAKGPMSPLQLQEGLSKRIAQKLKQSLALNKFRTSSPIQRYKIRGILRANRALALVVHEPSVV